MPTYVGTTVNNVNISADRIPTLVNGDDKDFCKMSMLQKFLDFFREIFVCHTLQQDYQALFDAVHCRYKDAGLIQHLDKDEQEKWHVLLCVARVIDRTKDQYLKNYSIETTKEGNDGVSVNFMYLGKSIGELSFSNEDMEAVIKFMFSENNRELVERNSHTSLIPFENILYEKMASYLKSPGYHDVPDDIDNEGGKPPEFRTYENMETNLIHPNGQRYNNWAEYESEIHAHADEISLGNESIGETSSEFFSATSSLSNYSLNI